MSIEPRLVERRRVVAETRAKRNVARLLKFMTFVAVVSSIVWLFFSPWLSIGEVETTGVSVSGTNTILADQGVVAGTPMIMIRAGSTEQALLQDPWVAEADVQVRWPNRVIVTVVERAPVAWTETSGGWTRRALDGVALPSAPEPDDELPRIELPEITDESAPTASVLIGALEFVANLPSRRQTGTVVTTNEGELWATVNGYQVRLGRPVEMREKALSLDALLQEDLVEGSVLVMVAPTNPAVTTPTPEDNTSANGADGG
ncbi:MAG: FtsQ-type POTRA domain-containing protein [Acidimicrobiia bacterium]